MRERLRESEVTIDRLVKRDGELVLAYAEIDRLKEKAARLEEVLPDVMFGVVDETSRKGRVISLKRSKAARCGCCNCLFGLQYR